MAAKRTPTTDKTATKPRTRAPHRPTGPPPPMPTPAHYVPAPVYYAGAYGNQQAYSPGALVATGGHVYVATHPIAKQGGESSNAAPADDSMRWDLLI